MVLWLIALAAGAAIALLQYGRSALRARTLPLAALRAVAVALIVALLANASAGRRTVLSPAVALDASESWTRGAPRCAAWSAALDSARRLGAGRWVRFGEVVRADGDATEPTARASALRPLVDQAAVSGRPYIVITDGELDDGELMASMPRGSRALVLPCLTGPDVAIASIEQPRALLAGDTVSSRVLLQAGARGGPAGRLELRLDDAVLATAQVAVMAPFAERAVELRGVAAGAERAAVVRAVFRGVGDAEPRNDTLGVGVDVTRAPTAVFISSSPDFDAREAIAALRGVSSLPTRAYFRVAAGAWRTEGTLERVDEATVRAAVREAPLVVLHGDTTVFGPPRAASRGSLLLFAGPAADEGEWFAAALPASPLSASLGALPLDSLPPLSVAAVMPAAQWQALMARRAGATDERRPVVVGWDEPRRVAVVGASGFWRWRFRGGVRADAYGALFGSLYDWLAAGRSDRRAAVPDAMVVRAGQPIRWRRGAAADTLVRMTLRRRDATARVQTITLRFPDGASIGESAPLVPGVYDATMPGGRALLVVNASRELVPRRATVSGRASGDGQLMGQAPALREKGWVYALVIVLLCAEWLLRRRAGLR